MERTELLKVDNDVKAVLEYLELRDVDSTIQALSDSIIIKKVMDAKVSTLALSGLELIREGKDKTAARSSALSTIEKSSINNKLEVVSIGYKADNDLGGQLKVGDRILVDIESSSYGIIYLALEANNRDPFKISHIFGRLPKLATERIEKFDEKGVLYKDEKGDLRITVAVYMKITPLHLVAIQRG